MEPVLDLDLEDQSIEIGLDDMNVNTNILNNTNYISSLQEWETVAKEHEILDGYKVSPEAAAEFQQKYQIQIDLPVSQRAIQAWSQLQHSKEYKRELIRMHALLRGGEDTRKYRELTAIKDLCIKSAYEQLAIKSQKYVNIQSGIPRMRICNIVLPIIGVVLFVVCMLEAALLIPSACPKKVYV